MRYLLIPLKDTALSGAAFPGCRADELTDDQREALSQTFERTLETCELLVTYAVEVAGKPSRQSRTDECDNAPFHTHLTADWGSPLEGGLRECRPKL